MLSGLGFQVLKPCDDTAEVVGSQRLDVTQYYSTVMIVLHFLKMFAFG